MSIADVDAAAAERHPGKARPRLSHYLHLDSHGKDKASADARAACGSVSEDCSRLVSAPSAPPPRLRRKRARRARRVTRPLPARTRRFTVSAAAPAAGDLRGWGELRNYELPRQKTNADLLALASNPTLLLNKQAENREHCKLSKRALHNGISTGQCVAPQSSSAPARGVLRWRAPPSRERAP